MFKFIEKQNKILILVTVVIVIAVVGGVAYLFKDKFIKNTMEKDNIRIELINPIDKRVLTKQGIDIITEAIKDGDYSIKVVNTSYDDRKDRIEKSIRLTINTSDNRYSYIIPSEMLYWEEGRAYKFETTQENNKKVDIIRFNNFKLSDFLNEDPNFIKELTPTKREVSFMINFSGEDVKFGLTINKFGFPNDWLTKGDGTGSFSYGMPINKYLSYETLSVPADKIIDPEMQGINTIKISSIKTKSNYAKLHITIIDVNNQNAVFIDKDIDLNSLTNGGEEELNFQIMPDWELIKQDDGIPGYL